MNKFEKGMTVIAINDSPRMFSTHFGDGVQAYKKGDKFKVINTYSDEIVVWHPLINSTMSLSAKNFQILEEYRQEKIETILE
jgi:hypothetical protein